MAKIRIKGDTSGYVDLEAPDAASSSTLDLDQVPQKNAANVFTTAQTIQNDNSYWAANIAESSHASVALRVTPTRAGYTKGISLGAIGKNGALSTGIQAYDTSDNSSNTLELNPHGGAVTAPGQPSFCAYDIQTSSGDIIYGSTWHNEGNHFNTTTGVFTAPITGVYHFSFSALMGNPVNTSHYTRLLWKINGSNNTRYGDTLDDRNKSGLTASGTSEYWPNQLSLTFKLSANDTITVYNGGSQKVYGAQYGHFCGHLVG